MKSRTCSVSGKQQYTNAARAKRVIAIQVRKARDTETVAAPLSTYRCIYCGHWHVTHYAPQEQRPFLERDRILRIFRKGKTRKES